MENTVFSLEFRIFLFYRFAKWRAYERKESSSADEMLSEELLSRFKTEADVSKFLNQLPVLLLEKMLEEEMDARLGYEKNSIARNNTGNSRKRSERFRYRGRDAWGFCFARLAKCFFLMWRWKQCNFASSNNKKFNILNLKVWKLRRFLTSLFLTHQGQWKPSTLRHSQV